MPAFACGVAVHTQRPAAVDLLYLHLIEKLRLCSCRDLNNAKGTQLNSNKLSQVSLVLNKGNAKCFLQASNKV